MAHVRHRKFTRLKYTICISRPVQVKGSDWLGDQDAIHYMCREAPRSVIEVRLPSCSLLSRVAESA